MGLEVPCGRVPEACPVSAGPGSSIRLAWLVSFGAAFAFFVRPFGSGQAVAWESVTTSLATRCLAIARSLPLSGSVRLGVA